MFSCNRGTSSRATLTFKQGLYAISNGKRGLSELKEQLRFITISKLISDEFQKRFPSILKIDVFIAVVEFKDKLSLIFFLQIRYRKLLFLDVDLFFEVLAFLLNAFDDQEFQFRVEILVFVFTQQTLFVQVILVEIESVLFFEVFLKFVNLFRVRNEFRVVLLLLLQGLFLLDLLGKQRLHVLPSVLNLLLRLRGVLREHSLLLLLGLLIQLLLLLGRLKLLPLLFLLQEC